MSSKMTAPVGGCLTSVGTTLLGMVTVPFKVTEVFGTLAPCE